MKRCARNLSPVHIHSGRGRRQVTFHTMWRPRISTILVNKEPKWERRRPDCRKKYFLCEVYGSSEILPICEVIRHIAVELENYSLTCPTDFRMLWRGEREREWRDRFLLMMARQVWRLKLHLMPNCTTLQSLKRVGGRWIAARFNLCSW